MQQYRYQPAYLSYNPYSFLSVYNPNTFVSTYGGGLISQTK